LLLQHVQELLAELEAMGVHITPPQEEGVDGAEDEEDWVDDEEETEDVTHADGDVEMS